MVSEAPSDIDLVHDRDISLTFAKGMSVLGVFDEGRSALTLAEIARAASLDRASARRLTLTLLKLGYVRKNGNRFSLTPRVLVLAAGFLRANEFGRRIQPLLEACAGETGAGVALAMADGEHAVYVAQSTAQVNRFTLGLTVGSRLPLLSTAVGRVLLGWGDPEWSRQMIANAPLSAHTVHTNLDRGRIAADVATAAERGYAAVFEEFEAGSYGLAVPVGPRGEARAALGMAQMVARGLTPDLEALAMILRRHAATLAPLL